MTIAIVLGLDSEHGTCASSICWTSTAFNGNGLLGFTNTKIVNILACFAISREFSAKEKLLLPVPSCYDYSRRIRAKYLRSQPSMTGKLRILAVFIPVVVAEALGCCRVVNSSCWSSMSFRGSLTDKCLNDSGSIQPFQ